MTPKGPRARYNQVVESGEFTADAAQEQGVDTLERIYRELIDTPARSARPRRWLRRADTCWPAVRGAYLWGGVGRGKTWLMDGFFADLPPSRARRTHFHRFMRDVHRRRATYADVSDPLEPVAEDIAHAARVLCFDEFYVSDIADAMILGRLTEALFDRGVTLVATSNCEPEQLYTGGLQRARFLPAIERILAHCDVVNVDGGVDYRLRELDQMPLYSHGEGNEDMAALFNRLAPRHTVDTEIEINDRTITARAAGDSAVWFDFDALCRGPRSADDYIELATLFQWVIVSDVPQLDRNLENAARRFINLVDECYDRRVNLAVHAAAAVDALYVGKKLAFEFQRTRSRLTEMQSVDYLEQPHRP